MIDFDKPVRFMRVQDDDHVRYKPNLIGTFLDNEGRRRWVVNTRNWQHAFGFLVYDERGDVVKEVPEGSTRATGIFDATLVNGPLIRTVGEVIEGTGIGVNVTYEGDKAIKVELA